MTLEDYIEKRKKREPEFAKNFEENGYWYREGLKDGSALAEDRIEELEEEIKQLKRNQTQ